MCTCANIPMAARKRASSAPTAHEGSIPDAQRNVSRVRATASECASARDFTSPARPKARASGGGRNALMWTVRTSI